MAILPKSALLNAGISRVIRLLTILALAFPVSRTSPAQGAVDQIRLRATVKDVVQIAHFSGKITPVDFDPRFALTLQVESINPTDTTFSAGSPVTLAIHSQALLFGGKTKKGKTYVFSLQRRIEKGKTQYFDLAVLESHD